MIASNDEYLKEASNTLYTLNADFIIRERCRNREDYYNMITQFENEIEQQDAMLKQKDAEIEQLRAQLEKMKQTK